MPASLSVKRLLLALAVLLPVAVCSAKPLATSIDVARYTDMGGQKVLAETGKLTTDRGFVVVGTGSFTMAQAGMTPALLASANARLTVAKYDWVNFTDPNLDYSSFVVTEASDTLYFIDVAGKKSVAVNMAVRMVADGKNPLILGCVLDGGAPTRVLIRAVGPGMANVGLTGGWMPNPKFTVYDRNGNKIGTNDDWPVGLTSVMSQAGAFPLTQGSNDAAGVFILPAAPFTVHILGADGQGGDVLCEVYTIKD